MYTCCTSVVNKAFILFILVLSLPLTQRYNTILQVMLRNTSLLWTAMAVLCIYVISSVPGILIMTAIIKGIDRPNGHESKLHLLVHVLILV